MAKFIGNAFSLNMLDKSMTTLALNGRVVTKEEAVKLAEGATPAIGHADTAAVVGSDLGITGLFARVTVTLQTGDELLVAQYKGPRLLEGATALPDGAVIEYWYLVVG